MTTYAESDDLIIKGAKGIQDGLYNIKDGKLFKYKAKGGTVRTYPIVPSAEAKPTVIRSKTLLPTKDFKEWAKRVRETNPNVIVIPCDAEVVSADAVYGKWLPIEETIPTYDGGEKTWITGMKCSNCGKLLDLRVGYYYCPNCGARMKGGDDE